MRKIPYLLPTLLILMSTWCSCGTETHFEHTPHVRCENLLNPIEAFFYPADFKVCTLYDNSGHCTFQLQADSTKSSFAPTTKSTPEEVARYKELSKRIGNPTEWVENTSHFCRTWVMQGVKEIRIFRTQTDGTEKDITAQCGTINFETYRPIFDSQFRSGGDRSIFKKRLAEVTETDLLWLPGRDSFGLSTPPNPEHLRQTVVLRLTDGTEIRKVMKNVPQ